jgi:uncharacterized membrane protein
MVMAREDWVSRALDVVLAFVFLMFAFDADYSVFANGQVFALPLAWTLIIISYILIIRAFIRGRTTNAVYNAFLYVAFVAFAVYVVIVAVIWNVRSFGTDEILFAWYASILTLHGLNPYVVGMKEITDIVQMPFLTQMLNGDWVTHYSYPALSFLVFTPFVALGMKAIEYVMFIFFFISLYILYVDTDPNYRQLPLIIFFVSNIFVDYVAGGVTDTLYLPFVLLSMRYYQRGKYTWSGVFLGIADNMKQVPWLIILFLWLYLIKNKQYGDLKKLTIGWFLAFVIPNIPFMLFPNPLVAFPAWLKGVLYPATAQLVSQGFGLAAGNMFSFTFSHWFMTALTIAFAAYLVIAFFFIAKYPESKWLAWVITMFIWYVTYRSLVNYFIYFIPIAYYAVLMMMRDMGATKHG